MNKQIAVIIFTVLYICGIIAFIFENILLFSIIFFLLSSYFLFFNKIFSQKYILIFLLAFILGIFNTSFNIKYDNSLVPYSDNDLTLNVKVLTIPTNNIKDRTKFFAEIKQADFENTQLNVSNEKILVTINDFSNKLSNIKIGDTIQLYGRLKIPGYAQNPSQFDYSRYLRYKKTFCLFYAEDNWSITERASDLKGKTLSRLNDTRDRILKIHAKNLKSPMIEILGGIIFGDDAVNPDENTKESFINSGIFHILAASGMNVTLIFGIWFFIAVRLKFNYKFSIITGILLILFYTFMTGFGPPIIRASLMLILILIGKLIDRAAKTMSLLFVVGFLMLLFNPLMLFDIGFQLSFTVTFALILTAPLLNFNFKYKWLNNITGACFIPIIAQFYAAPLQMFYFNTFTLYSVFANIIIIPFLSIISFVGFISSILALIPLISENICFLADLILNPLLVFIVKTAEFFANLPNSIIFLKKPDILQLILYYIVLIGFTCLLQFKIKHKKFFFSLCLLFAIFICTFMNIPNKNPEIIYFSVGNADSFFVKTNKNDYFIIDTGKNGYKGSNSAAKNIMIKYMRDMGIKSLNAVILSHFDADHAGGTVDILDNIKVKKLYITDVCENTNISDEIKNYVKEHNIDEEVITDTKEIYNEDGFVITLLKPKNDLIKSENQKSLIVHLSYKNRNLLFMGDGDINSYNALPLKFKQNIDVIKSGHHGAKNTVNDEMSINSKLFILSTGQNPYNHPNIETLNMIKSANKKYLRTDHNNAIKVILMQNNIQIQQYSPKNRRFEKIISENPI